MLKDVTYNVITESNANVTVFDFNQSRKAISFNVAGETGAIGYVNVTIPKALLDLNLEQPPYQWLVFIDKNPATPEIATNATHTFIYLAYAYSRHEIEIMGNEVVPEIPTSLVLPLFIVATSLAIIISVYKTSEKKVTKRQL